MSTNLRTLYNYICIYFLITYFCMFKFYFDYLFALNIVFCCRKLNFKPWVWCAVVSFPLIVGQFFSCADTMVQWRFFFLVWAQGLAQGGKSRGHIFSKTIKKNVKGTMYILYTIIFKYLSYNMHLFWMVQ